MASNETPDGQSLLALAKTGDTGALGQLLERYRPYLSLLVRLQLGRRLQIKLDVDDVLQETFLKAHRDLPAFRGRTEAELMTWLRLVLGGVLANQVRHYYGTQRRDPRLEQGLHDDIERSSVMLDGALIATQSTPSQQAARREQSVRLAVALERLPETYRSVIIHRHLEGLTFAEVARQMEKTEDSVKNLWVRALARLRSLLDDST